MARTDDVVDAIKGMILDGRLRPGDRLPVEPELAAQLDLSRGSLREGVRALSAMGVLESRQGAGTYVTDLGLKTLFAPMEFIADLDHYDAVDFLRVRRVLECDAAASAARLITLAQVEAAQAQLDRAMDLLTGSADPDHEAVLACDWAFHGVIAQAGGNPVTEALLEVLAGRTRQLRLWHGQVHRPALRRAVDEHAGILAALREGDADRARARMQVHLFGVEDFVRSHRADDAAYDTADGAADGATPP